MNRVSGAAIVTLALALVACGGGAPAGQGSADASPPTGDSEATPDAPSATGDDLDIDLDGPCRGPQGEQGANPDEVALTAEEVETIRSGEYTAAVSWAGSGPWYEAVDAGFDEALVDLNIERVGTASAEYDAARQATDVENLMGLDPDIVLGSPVDAVAAAEAYRPVVEAGKVLVLSDNVPQGYVAGEDYVSFVAGNRCEGAELMADLMAEAIGGEGEIAMIYYDADYYVTNVLDDYFRAAIAQKYPEIAIVADSGFAEEGATQEIASAILLQHPDIAGVYTTWSIPAQGVIAALRENDREDVRVVTHDLDLANDVDLAAGRNMYATVVEDLRALGYKLGVLAAYGILDKEAPAFVPVDYIVATRETLLDAYERVFGETAPAEIVDALDP